jgi:hypothetical protein
MKNPRLVAVLAPILLFCLNSAIAACSLPQPWYRQLNEWHFNEYRLYTVNTDAPQVEVGFTLTPDWDTNALRLTGDQYALVQYPVVEPNGRTNVTFDFGSARFYYRPLWSSTNLNGTGPGHYARLLEVGLLSGSATYGWWSIYLNPAGTQLSFAGQANGESAEFVNAAVSLNSNQWYQIVVTYSPSNSFIYVDGELVGEGEGVSRFPGTNAQAQTGLSIGCTSLGGSLMRGDMDWLQTFNYQLCDWNITNEYWNPNPPASSGGSGPSSGGSPGPPGSSGGSGGSGGTNSSSPAYYGLASSTNLWIEILPPTNHISVLLLHNTLSGTNYQVLSRTALHSNNNWFVLQDVFGAENTNCTVTTVNTDVLPSQFMICGVSEDADGDGLSDIWEAIASHTSITNADTGSTGIPDGYKDPDNDGWTNLDEMRNGTDPLRFNTPAPPQNVQAHFSAGGTNITITWEPARGPVLGYRIVGRWQYGEIATVGSNTVSFSFEADLWTGDPNQFQETFLIEAIYDDGILSESDGDAIWDERLALTPWLVRGMQGQKFLCIGAWPANVTEVLITLHSGTQIEIPRTNFINGIYTVTTGVDIAWQSLQGVDVDGFRGPPKQIEAAVEGDYFSTNVFVDVRQTLSDNLRFALRAATATWGLNYHYPFGSFYPLLSRTPVSPDYEFSGLRAGNWFFIQGWDVANNLNRAVTENSLWRNFAFSSSVLAASNGTLTTGARIWPNIDSLTRYISSGCTFIQTNLTTNSLLSAQDTEWIWFRGLSAAQAQYYPEVSGEIGLSMTPYNYTLNSSHANLFGLPIVSVKGVQMRTNFSILTISPGSTVFGGGYNYTWFANYQQPIFQTDSYYFAGKDDSIPGDADFSPTNTTGIFIGTVGNPIYVSGWAKKRIMNGNTNKFGFLEQFFDKAYKADANGNATTNETGILSEYGEFFPTEPGRVILTTKPDIETSEVGQVLVNVIHLGVDANHDGEIDRTFAGPDDTSSSNPFRFWLNNDGDGNLWGVESDRATIDNSDNQIKSARDLEDFARLWISGVPGISSYDGYEVSLEWQSYSGTPAVRLFESIETNGGNLYLTDTNVAWAYVQNQNPFGLGTVRAGTPFIFPINYFAQSGRKHFLFEGVSAGSGALALTVKKNGIALATTTVNIQLQDIKEMYEQAYAENVSQQPPPSDLVSLHRVRTRFAPTADETKQIIVFVHGANNTEFDYESTSATFYKRLYWSGYRGRFASFRWPSLLLPNCAFEVPTASPFNFNKSEYVAWKSAHAFRDYLLALESRSGLEGYTLNVVAHSQGNIVASEAILQGGPFDNYIASQGAVPAHCYDPNAPTLQMLLNAETNKPTPYSTGLGGYHDYFAAINGNVVNFFNPDDFALVTGTCGIWNTNWEENHAGKPDSQVTYFYAFDGTNCFRVYSSFTNTVVDSFEKKAMIARSRTKAVGAKSGLGGVIGISRDLSAAPFDFGRLRSEHSAQFTRNIQSIRPYYQQVLREFNIEPVP